MFARTPNAVSMSSKLHTDQSGSDGMASLRLSETPLTDQEVGKLLQTGYVQKVSADFARELERKLNEISHRTS